MEKRLKGASFARQFSQVNTVETGLTLALPQPYVTQQTVITVCLPRPFKIAE